MGTCVKVQKKRFPVKTCPNRQVHYSIIRLKDELKEIMVLQKIKKAYDCTSVMDSYDSEQWLDIDRMCHDRKEYVMGTRKCIGIFTH